MVKAKAKTRAIPKKRRLYEVAGAEDDLLPSSKKRARLDNKEEKKEGVSTVDDLLITKLIYKYIDKIKSI